MRCTLCVQNLGLKATADEVLGLVSPFGQVRSIRLFRDPQVTTQTMTALVEMATAPQAGEAMTALAGHEHHGRLLATARHV